MTLTGEIVLVIVGQIATAGGVYAAIRADLREALVRVKYLEKRMERLEGVA
ncbi:MAG: hypothetical protein ACOVPA_14560 [Rubrivivax sp.]